MKRIIDEHLKKYPAMTLQDKVKLIYQNELGCGHFIKDKDKSIALINEEFENRHKTDTLFEDIGNGYVRMYLSALDEVNFDAEIINSLFTLSAEEISGTKEGLINKLSCLEDDGYITEYIKNGCPMVSHSSEYRKAYLPTYRVIKKIYADLYFLCLKIKKKSAKKDIVVSLDGRAAAGKTTAAEALRRIFNAGVIHADDFFLPFEMRTEQRLAEAGGNIHYERLKDEIILELSSPTLTYGRFDCSKGMVTEKISVKKSPVTVIEGAYSSHPFLGNVYDLRVFFDIDATLQKERILNRNGEKMLKKFTDIWIPMENKYIEHFGIKDKADIIIKT
ncbi:MAG: hypothetical protein E7235_02725 [Lachnospiraceae bacterium]|nr:hypothetical protein [Lachnospiraceae bacterium]